MACGSCSKGGCSPAGCRNNGGCSTGGCNRLNVFDWLTDMEEPQLGAGFDLVEVRFKGGRKEFYRNSARLPLTTGDAVVVEMPSGHHIGYVSLKGELVRLQMKKKKVEVNEEIKQIYRIATEKDLEKFELAKEMEPTTMFRARQIISQQGLKMKLSDVEYQADKTKATFFYSADDRVDFRDLIKKLAEEFRVRIEMRQISLRHEAGRLGGIGSCGRELCCSTWLTDFKSVSTTAARYQNLSLNPSKLSGQCGRLKCCLNYELETYMEALKDIPNVSRPLQTVRGDAQLQKTDIFRKIMWFGFRDDNNWYPVPVERVKEIMALNSKGEAVEYLVPEVKETAKKIEFVDKLEGDLDELAEKYKTKTKKRKKKKKGPGDKGEATGRGPRPAGMAVDGNGMAPAPMQTPAETARAERNRDRLPSHAAGNRSRKGNHPNRPAPAPDGNAPASAEAAATPGAERPERSRSRHRSNRSRKPDRPNPNPGPSEG